MSFEPNGVSQTGYEAMCQAFAALTKEYEAVLAKNEALCALLRGVLACGKRPRSWVDHDELYNKIDAALTKKETK